MLPALNSVTPSWTEIGATANINGGTSLVLPDIKAFNWESAIARGEQRGASGGRVIKRTTGAKTDTASWEMYQGGLRDFARQLMAVAPKDSAGRPMLSKVSFDIVIKWSVDDDADIFTVKFLGCHLDKLSGSHAEGTDPNVISSDLNPIEIVEVIDGQDVVLL